MRQSLLLKSEGGKPREETARYRVPQILCVKSVADPKLHKHKENCNKPAKMGGGNKN